jgi:hypothetical protein
MVHASNGPWPRSFARKAHFLVQKSRAPQAALTTMAKATEIAILEAFK